MTYERQVCVRKSNMSRIPDREEIVVLRKYPSLWQVWRQPESGEAELIAEQPQKPLGEALDRIIMGKTDESESNSNSTLSQSQGLFASVKNFLRALNN